MQHGGQLAAVGRVQAALQRQAGLLPQHGVLGAGEVLDQREEAVVGRELAALQPDLEVEPVLGRVELDLRAPAAAVEERAEKAVEVGRDALDVWSLRLLMLRLYPSPPSSAADRRGEAAGRVTACGGAAGSAPDTIECRIRRSGHRPLDPADHRSPREDRRHRSRLRRPAAGHGVRRGRHRGRRHRGRRGALRPRSTPGAATSRTSPARPSRRWSTRASSTPPPTTPPPRTATPTSSACRRR